MGIQINGNTDNISATDGSLTITGASIGNITGGLNVTSGSVGIGTDNPSHKLEVQSGVNGTFFISGKSSKGVDIFKVYESSNGDGNNGMVYLQDGSGNTDVKLSTNGSSYFKGGNLGIGTDNPSKPLQVHSDSSSAVLVTGYTPQIRFNSSAGDGTDADRVILGRATGNDQFIPGSVDGDAILRCATSKKVMIGYGTTEIAQFNSSGLKFKTSGMGIDFSATSDGSGTTTSELFDDYEEGTFTPEITQGVTGTPTYEYQLGWYTKIGRIVTAYFYIKFASSGNTGSNSIFRVGNLPFPVVSTNNGVLQRGMGVSNYHSIPGFTSSNVSFYGGGNSNTFASVYQGNNSVATSSAVNSQYIIGGFEYISE